ncbi:MAG: arginine--tRNA ligase, partial [Bacillota bacterium]|nr:arginine--tRNA ligase [Bacillota bacterium]
MFDYKQYIAEAVTAVLEGALPLHEVHGLIEYPKNPEMGDYSFPCFRLSKALRKAPPVIAQEIAQKIREAGLPLMRRIEAVSGFVNFELEPRHLAENLLHSVLTEQDRFGNSTLGADRLVIVEYSSTNIAKPFHIGHMRSTVIGESLQRIYRAMGYRTYRINHLGDYGTQFGKLIVAYRKWGEEQAVRANPIPELHKLYVRFHSEAESDPSLDEQAREQFTKLEQGDPEAKRLWQFFVDVSLQEFARVYKKLDIEYDSYNGESFYSDKMGAVLDQLRDQNLVQKSEGAEIIDLEDVGLIPALVTKKDGSTLYLTRDIAAAIYRKTTYDFHKCIYVVGEAQSLHFKQLFAVLRKMGFGWVEDCVHVAFGMVDLGGAKLSTRAGNVVFLDDVLEAAREATLRIIEEKNPTLKDKDEVAKQVGYGAVIFQELYTSRDKDYSFQIDKVTSFQGETGPYVQYTHARCCSILSKNGAFTQDSVRMADSVDYGLLSDAASIDVLKQIRKFPEIIDLAHRVYEPHHIARFAVDLAQMFNRFYHDYTILTEDAALTTARLELVKA